MGHGTVGVLVPKLSAGTDKESEPVLKAGPAVSQSLGDSQALFNELLEETM